VRAEREIVSHVRVGAGSAWEGVTFGGEGQRVVRHGVDVTVDTRLDPFLARNAVYVRTAVEHLGLGDWGGRASANRFELDVRGYLGLIRRTVLVTRILRQDADAPLPPYLKPLLGGLGTVRGFEPGRAVGDGLAAASAELLVPLTSPLHVTTAGVSVFGDVGAAYDKGARLRDQHAMASVGASVWVSATVVRVSLAVAHGLGGPTRVLFGGGLAF
jgi:outer membrane protein assembly factor BamA